jgi:UDPglucose 6-dehydrogenase
MGYDPRIGTKYLEPGIGFGGSCLPKDVRALGQLAAERDYAAPLLHAVELVNREQAERIVRKIDRGLSGLGDKTVAVLGLAFKPNTDDVRDAPALRIIRLLIEHGASIRAHDPVANEAARVYLGPCVAFFDDMYDAVAGCDAVLVATEWGQFRAIDLDRCAELMRGDLVVDGRNLYDPAKVRAANLRYVGVGRGARAAAKLPG